MPRPLTRTSRRFLVLSGCFLALGLALAGTSSAQAASQDLSYSCFYAVDGAQGTVAAVARFDSSIDEAGPLEAGDPVGRQEWRGSVTFAPDFTSVLAHAGIDTIAGDGLMSLFVDGHKAETDVGLAVSGDRPAATEPTVLVVVGGFTLEDSGSVGTHTLQAAEFIADLEDDGVTKESLHCALVAGEYAAVDVFDVTAPTASPPPSTPPPTATPVRPVLVQTDAAQDTHLPRSWSRAAAVLLFVTLAAPILRSVRKRPARRH